MEAQTPTDTMFLKQRFKTSLIQLVFPHVTLSMAGVKLESLEEVKNLIGDTKTETGLKVFVKTSKKYIKKVLRSPKN